MKPVIYLAFVDDWEVRGNGSGDPRVLQFEPMRKLVSIFNRHGIRGSFNVEVMQQLAYRKMQERFPELKAVADEWEEVVTESFRQGHDIQLHLHPQWRDATYEGRGKWRVDGDWSILNYPASEMRAMLTCGKNYLEGLLRAIEPNYSCVSFRAGSWCAAPSDALLPILSELGFVFDMSIVAGIRYDTPEVKLDYTQCEETFAPYYPEMKDARRVAGTPQPMVCLPTNSFSGARFALLRRDLGKAQLALRRKVSRLRNGRGRPTGPSRGHSGEEWTNRGESGAVGLVRRICRRYVTGQTHIADLSRLNYAMMQRMMAKIRKQAETSGLARVPVILENHTKDILDFSHIERLAASVARAPDITTMTLTDIANELRNGTFQIRTA